MAKKKIPIHVDKIIQIPFTGINRALIFMGFGVNSADNPDFTDFKLSKHTHHHWNAYKASDSQIKKFKNEYRNWIIGCSLREILEHYSLYLERVADCCFILQNPTSILHEYYKAKKSFERKSLREKLDYLNTEYNIGTKNNKLLLTLQGARNCLVHRLGVVGSRDLIKNRKYLYLHWKAFRLASMLKNKVKKTMRIHDDKPLKGEEGDELVMQHYKREKRYKLGQKINLSLIDLNEICQFAHFTTFDMNKSVVSYLKNKGVKVN